jgi:hypothetical protein
VRGVDKTAPPWEWSDGLPRVVTETEKARKDQRSAPSELNAELLRLRTEIDALAKATKEPSRLVQPRWWDLWLTVLGSVAITLTIIGVAVLERQSSRELAAVRSVRSLKAKAANPTSSVEAISKSTGPGVSAVDIAALIASGRYELVDDGFGRQLRGPLRPWTFYAAGEPAQVDIVAHAPASAEQSAFALVSGTVLLQPYSRKAVNVLLAVRVPTTRGFGFMIFNTRERRLVDQEVRLAREPLQDHTWFQVGSKRILHLATPVMLASEISLAPH